MVVGRSIRAAHFGFVKQLPRRRRGAVAVAVRQPGRLGDVFAPADTWNFQDPAQHTRARGPQLPQRFGIQHIAHDHEAVAEEDARGALDLVWFDDLQARQTVVQVEVLAQSANLGVVVDPALGRAGIQRAKAGLAKDRIAVVVGGLVRRRRGAPADIRLPGDTQRRGHRHCV